MNKLLFLAGLLIFSGCNEKPEKVVIGYYGTLTGKQATYGLSSLRGIELAIKLANKNGGVLEAPVELKYYDTQNSVKVAKETVEKLITTDKVISVIGENISDRTLAGAAVAQFHKIPMITPSGTSPKITEVGDYIFRACFIDPFQGSVIAKFAYNTLKHRKAAVFRDSQSEYSLGLADSFVKKFTELGGTIVADEKYLTKDLIYLSNLLKIKKAAPDFLFVPGYYFDVSKIALQARDLKIKAPLLGGDGWDSADIFTLSKGAIEDSYFSTHYTQEDPRRIVQQFILDYLKVFGSRPDALAAAGFDAANMLFAAINNAGSTDPKAIRNALAEIKDFEGITGTITINDKRDAVKSAVVLQILNGAFNYVETISP